MRPGLEIFLKQRFLKKSHRPTLSIVEQFLNFEMRNSIAGLTVGGVDKPFCNIESLVAQSVLLHFDHRYGEFLYCSENIMTKTDSIVTRKPA